MFMNKPAEGFHHWRPAGNSRRDTMSAIQPASASARAIRPAHRPRSAVARLFLRAARNWQRNRAINELSRLDNWQLEDIGISRNDIPRVVEGLFSADEADAKPAPKVDYRGDAAMIVAHSCPQAA